jgi:hypothetical protein
MIAVRSHRIEPEVVARDFSAGWSADPSTVGGRFLAHT